MVNVTDHSHSFKQTLLEYLNALKARWQLARNRKGLRAVHWQPWINILMIILSFQSCSFSCHGRRSVCFHQQSLGLLIFGLPDVSQLQVIRPGHLRLLFDDPALPPTPFSIPCSTAGLPSYWRKCGFGGESFFLLQYPSLQECGILNLFMLRCHCFQIDDLGPCFYRMSLFLPF